MSPILVILLVGALLMPKATKQLVTLADAAEYACVNPRTIRRHIAAGHLTGYRLGQLIRIDLAELDALLTPIPTVQSDAGTGNADHAA